MSPPIASASLSLDDLTRAAADAFSAAALRLTSTTSDNAGVISDFYCDVLLDFAGTVFPEIPSPVAIAKLLGLVTDLQDPALPQVMASIQHNSIIDAVGRMVTAAIPPLTQAGIVSSKITRESAVAPGRGIQTLPQGWSVASGLGLSRLEPLPVQAGIDEVSRLGSQNKNVQVARWLYEQWGSIRDVPSWDAISGSARGSCSNPGDNASCYGRYGSAWFTRSETYRQHRPGCASAAPDRIPKSPSQ